MPLIATIILKCNSREILARGIARAKELAAKLAKNPPPKRSYDEASGYQQQMPSNASSFYSQQDAFNQYKRQAMGGGTIDNNITL